MPVHATLAPGATVGMGVAGVDAPPDFPGVPGSAVDGAQRAPRPRADGGPGSLTAPANAAELKQQTRQATSARRAGKRKTRRRLSLVLVGVGLAIAAGVGYELMPSSGGGPAHTITTPAQIGTFKQAPELAESMNATQLRDTIVRDSRGEASHVVDAVYKDAAASNAAPGILLFIGGNLHGASASDFISSFTGRLAGATTTSPGSLGGAAACVPSEGGNPAECAWADDDTFGVVLSPNLDAQALASELRQMRPQLEHVTH
jgi:hypothetical protein